jgi:hypothetical protein
LLRHYEQGRSFAGYDRHFREHCRHGELRGPLGGRSHRILAASASSSQRGIPIWRNIAFHALRRDVLGQVVPRFANRDEVLDGRPESECLRREAPELRIVPCLPFREEERQGYRFRQEEIPRGDFIAR